MHNIGKSSTIIILMHRVYTKFGMDLRATPKRFYRGLFVASDGSKMVLYAADDINVAVRECTSALHLHMDGTFHANPNLKDSAQLFIIHAQVKNTVKQIKTYTV